MAFNTPIATSSSLRWVKVSKSHTDFQDASTSKTITLYTLPVKGVVHDVKVSVTTPMAGTATYTLSLGVTGSLTKYINTVDAKSATVYGTSLFNTLESISLTTDIKVTADSTVNNLDASTNGAVDFYILYSTLT